MIDDAIVVVENIVMHRDAGQSRAEAIRSAIREIRVPLVGSTITPIVVFLPLISITGVTGVFFRALAVTVGVALLTSLALALTWTPTLSHYFIRSRAGRAAPASTDSVPPRLMRVYERVLRITLEHPLVLAVFALLLIGGIVPLLHAHRHATCCRRWTKAASSSTTSCPPAPRSRRPIASSPTWRRFCARRRKWRARRAAPACNWAWPQVTEANTGDISVKLKRDRKRSGEEVIADVRAKIKKAEPVLDVEFPQLLQDMIGDLTSAPEPVVIKLFCQDPELLRSWAPQVADAIKKIPGVVDVLDGIENTISGPATVFNVDPAVAARAGFTPQEVELDASAMLQGEPAPPPGGGQRPLLHHPRALSRSETRASLDAIRNTLLVSGTGKTGDHRLAGRHAWRSRARPKSAARTCSATCR